MREEHELAARGTAALGTSAEGVVSLDVRLVHGGPFANWPIQPVAVSLIRELERSSMRNGRLDEFCFMAKVVIEGSPELKAGLSLAKAPGVGPAASLVLRFSLRGRIGILAQLSQHIFALSGFRRVESGSPPSGVSASHWRTLHRARFPLPAYYRRRVNRRPISRTTRPCRRVTLHRTRARHRQSARRARARPRLDDPPDVDPAEPAPPLARGGLTAALVGERA